MDEPNLNPKHEEIANAVTHGLGFIASAVGSAVLITTAALYGDDVHIVSVTIFGGSLLLLYATSTFYHSARRKRTKSCLQIFDHCAIFVLIAGTYTPFTLISLRGGWGWSLFGIVWGLALVGIIFKLFFTGRFERLSTMIYVAMGWLVIVAAGPMLRALPVSTLGWLFAGGLTYSAGVLFYHSHRIPYAHAIWHLFVLGGSICHYIAVLFQTFPQPAT